MRNDLQAQCAPPEALLGGPIALVRDGDTIIVDVNADRIDCVELRDDAVYTERLAAWHATLDAHDGSHPDAPEVTHRVLRRMRRTALPALRGGGMSAE